MKILVKFPTMERPKKFFQTMSEYVAFTADNSRVEYLVTLNDNEPHKEKYLSCIEDLKKMGTKIEVNYISNGNKILACNYGLEIKEPCIIVLASDDMRCMSKNWDNTIVADMERLYPNLDGCLWYSDGFVKEYCTMNIMGSERYKKFGYLYNPEYKSFFCDNEYTEVAIRDGKMNKEPMKMLFRHEHPLNTRGIYDNNYMISQKFWAEDKATFERRKKNNFANSEKEAIKLSLKEVPKANFGVLLIACGSEYYGSWAINVAMAIKAITPNVPITLAWHGNRALDFIRGYLPIFDELIELKDEQVTSKGVISYLKTKVSLYDISPYKETIFLDADTMPMRKSILDLYDKVKGADLVIGNRGKRKLKDTKHLTWAKIEDISEKYTDEIEVFDFSSEFIFFKRSEKVQLFFEKSKYNFEYPEIKGHTFAGDVADEHAFVLTHLQTGIGSEIENFLPFFWEAYEKKVMQVQDVLNSDYFGISAGGHHISPFMKAMYDSEADLLAKKFGLKYPFVMYEKRQVIKNR